MNTYDDWYNRTKSKLKSVSHIIDDPEIHFDDTMYGIQQAVEFALKTLIIFYSGELPAKTHDISVLAATVEQYVSIPPSILDVILTLTLYISRRYPHEYEIGTHEDCEEAFIAATQLISFVGNQISFE